VIPKPDYLGYSVSKGRVLGARVLSAMFTPMTCRRVLVYQPLTALLRF